MRPESITLAIEEHYTPEEKKEIADQLAMAISDLDTIRGEKKVSDAAFNERIKSKEAAIDDLAKRYNKGCETAQIGCDIKYDVPEAGKKSYVRFDNGEVVSVHDMSWEEKQETIQFPLAEQKSEESGDEVISATFGQDGADEVKRLMAEMQAKCEHPSVSQKEGVWTCDACDKVLDETPLATEEKPFDVGQVPPPEDFNQDTPEPPTAA